MKLQEIENAASRLEGVIHKTPLISSRTFSDISGAEVYLKCENQQKTGSFKVRGAYNKIAELALQAEIDGKDVSVIASSAGNHAQGVAYASSALGVKSTIVMPLAAPLAKVMATEGYGAKVVLSGSCYDDAYDTAVKIQKEENATFVHPFDDEKVIAGQGTIGIEILREIPTVDAILVPAGGGGLLAGIASCVKQINPRIRVIGVQSEGANAIQKCFKNKKYTCTKSSVTIADGIAVKNPGKVTTDLINEFVDDVVTVTDDEISETILLLLERAKQVVEPAGAASLAAVINKKIDLTGQKVVCVLSGGNIDVGFIHKVVEKGLLTRGRKMKFSTVLNDVPGSLERFSQLVAKTGANIIMIQHDRLDSDLGLGEAILHVACEVSGPEHSKQVIDTLKKNGYHVY